MDMLIFKRMFLNILVLSVVCFDYTSAAVWNNPYPQSQKKQKIFYSSFAERPKTLDPAKSYSSNEYQFISQIYEPPLQYDYLKRPYTLIPLTAMEVPNPIYLSQDGREIKENGNEKVSYSVYTIKLRPGIYYQPHPAFAKTASGEYYYHNLGENYLEDNGINNLSEFKHTATRELVAADYIYQIKRIASPKIHSPILGLMSEYIVGMKAFSTHASKSKGKFDLNKVSLEGVEQLDRYTYTIKINGKYPQFLFWLAMPFFSPVPWEADKFYSQPEMDDKNITLNWYPVGTGAFMLTENNPNRRMVLSKNPNFHDEYFPSEGSAEDKARGYLKASGKKLPLIDKAIFSLEKESIPRWNKFLQGYYDSSGISADSFDQAIKMNLDGKPSLTPVMKEKKIRLASSVEPSIFYLGFNMLDDVVGGKSEQARKLRLAISIAINYEENIAIFYNGRGLAAQGPIPPGIFGYLTGRAGMNPYVYEWENNNAQRRPIEQAKNLLAQAGYPNGRSQKTGQVLLLNYDVPASNSPDDKARLDWMRKQFSKLGIQLNVRATQYNRFQEKMRTGNAQIFTWGWHADYPDPENFLFLLYGPNSKVKHGGENAANYDNKQFNTLFEQMKNIPNNDIRQDIITKMIAIVRYDSPWSFGIYPKSFVLNQQWKMPAKLTTISYNTMKFVAVDVLLRNQLRKQWNQPVLWPIGLVLFLGLVVFCPVLFAYRQKEQAKAPRRTDV
jgi:peptide/nickel transport system substrate-binding protein